MSEPSTSSGRQTASVAIMAAPGKLRGIMAEADGTNAATIIVYDNATAASGTILAKIVVDAGLTYECLLPPGGIVANAGLYLSLSGTGAAAVVLYDRG